jgi:hypothetical protein
MTFVSIILAVIVIGGLLAYLRSTDGQSKHSTGYEPSNNPIRPTLDVELVRQRWTEIAHMQTQGGMGLKNALMEADKLLDYVMQAQGFTGENMGERLKRHGDRFSDLNGVWAAHKLRNQIAHDVHVDIVKPQVTSSITSLGRAISDLGVQLV